MDDLQDALKKKGTSAFVIEDSLAHEALALLDELKPYKVGLTEAVRFFIQHAPKQKGAKINDIIPEYLQTKADVGYRKAQEIALNRFAIEFGNKLVAGVFPDALRKWFKKQGWKPLNERNYMRDISMFFKWCKLHDYCTVSPMEKVPRPKVHIATPPIYSVDEAFKLPPAAREKTDLAMLEFVAFAFFTGIRVEELERMDWHMVVWDQNEICLPEPITKTHRPRNVPINDALKVWVQPTAKITGRLFESTNLRNRKDDLFDAAKVSKKRNGFRHTFASYHAALHRNVSDLQMILGQRTPSVLFTHYVTAARKDEGRDFFCLTAKRKTMQGSGKLS